MAVLTDSISDTVIVDCRLDKIDSGLDCKKDKIDTVNQILIDMVNTTLNNVSDNMVDTLLDTTLMCTTCIHI